MNKTSLPKTFNLKNLVLVDSWLVRVIEEDEQVTDSGIVIPYSSQELNNMGVVVKEPRFITTQPNKNFISLPSREITDKETCPWAFIKRGDIVFFPGNLSYPVIEHTNNGALILVSKEQILGYYRNNEGDGNEG